MPPAAAQRLPQLRELGTFLRTRRGALDPATLDLPDHRAQRRVPGLRREEVADLAAISADYYARIEQGRLIPSGPVLDSLVRVLQLDEDQADYVLSLVDHAAQTRLAPGVVAALRTHKESLRVRPQLQALLDQLPSCPALVLGPRMDVLAWNSLAELVYTRFSELPASELNFVRLVFTNPEMRALFADWPSVARACVAILRREAAANPEDPALAAVVGELTIADRDFGRWWAARNVTRQDFGTKTLNHPEVGELVFDWEAFRYASAPEQQLMVNLVKEGSPTQERLARLAARAATP